MESDSTQHGKRTDPYEFEDDVGAPAVRIEDYKRNVCVKVVLRPISEITGGGAPTHEHFVCLHDLYESFKNLNKFYIISTFNSYLCFSNASS